MKKIEKYIYLVLGLILIVVIACSVTYIIATNNNNTETNEEPNNQEGNNSEESITLSESELEEYLSYVPIDTENYLNRNVYKASVNLDSIDKTLLRDMGIIKISNCFDNDTCPFDTSNEILIKIDLFPYYENNVTTKYIPLTYLNELLHQMYNYELTNLENASSIEDSFDAGGMSYIYQDGYFLSLTGGSSGGEHISVLDNYEATEEELVIYEYAAYYDSFENKLIDYHTTVETDLGGWCGNTTYEEKMIILQNYLEEHKTEFTLYKHTFKKNDTGYYWYQTEIT